jgi:hypothetical protein
MSERANWNHAYGCQAWDAIRGGSDIGMLGELATADEHCTCGLSDFRAAPNPGLTAPEDTPKLCRRCGGFGVLTPQPPFTVSVPCPECRPAPEDTP